MTIVFKKAEQDKGVILISFDHSVIKIVFKLV